jgi:hypothetical protein
MEIANEDDIILYVDSGCELNLKGRKRFLEYIDIVKKEGCLCFENYHLEKSWTKMDLIVHIGNDNNDTNSNQLEGGIVFYKKNKENLEFINNIISISEYDNYHLLDDSPSKILNDESFNEHRHDQSIFSCLWKKNKKFYIKPSETWFPTNESVWKSDWRNKGQKYPIWAMRNRTGNSLILKFKLNT